MSYTVLARRYRSKDFDDLIGQEPVAQTLKNAIASNRVAHAYLFCGTRGVGKTSVARILAKALNCEKGPTAKPCNVCDRCKAISAGEDIDVVEIDGASNRGIDEIRNLRNNAIYRPARSPYKIYIIDEVHMLTKEAFNALLKTLEEPPSHVKFIFATTEVQRVPQTIASRCQQFVFRLIPTGQIADRLRTILAAEKIGADDEVIARVARAGRGSMRDALSLMDQLLAMGAEKITEDMVEYLLGEPASDQILALADAFANGDAAAGLTRTDQLLASGFAPEQFVVSLIEHLRRLMLVGLVGPDCEFLDLGSAERAPLAEQAKRFNPMTLVYMIQVLEQLRQSVRASTTAARALIDAAMVRLALLDQFADTAELIERLEGGGAGPAGDSKKKAQPAVTAASPAPPAAPTAAVRTSGASVARPPANGGPTSAANLGEPVAASDTPLEQIAGDELWNNLIARLSQARMMTLAGPLALTRLVGAEGSTLKVAARGDLIKLLSVPQRQQQLESVMGQLLGRSVKIEWAAQDGAASSRPAATRGGNGGAGGSRAEGRPAGGGESLAPGPGPAQRLSQREIDQVVSDAAIRQMMQLFNATVVGVERKGGEQEVK